MTTQRKPKAKAGAAPKYDRDAVTAEICSRVSNGEHLRGICRENHMPNFSVVYDWINEDEDFAQRFARARETGADAIAYEALEIADTPVEAIREKLSDGKREVTKEDALGHRRLQVETRIKLLAKWFPKKYGDKQEITGPDGGPLVVQVVKFGE